MFLLESKILSGFTWEGISVHVLPDGAAISPGKSSGLPDREEFNLRYKCGAGVYFCSGARSQNSIKLKYRGNCAGYVRVIICVERGRLEYL